MDLCVHLMPGVATAYDLSGNEAIKEAEI